MTENEREKKVYVHRTEVYGNSRQTVHSIPADDTPPAQFPHRTDPFTIQMHVLWPETRNYSVYINKTKPTQDQNQKHKRCKTTVESK